jgi:hypothetical protein
MAMQDFVLTVTDQPTDDAETVIEGGLDPRRQRSMSDKAIANWEESNAMRLVTRAFA